VKYRGSISGTTDIQYFYFLLRRNASPALRGGRTRDSEHAERYLLEYVSIPMCLISLSVQQFWHLFVSLLRWLLCIL